LFLLAGTLSGLVACNGGSPDSTPDSTPQVSTTAAPAASDGVFRIGLLIPQTGPGDDSNESLTQVATDAIEIINASGGVLGQDIELIVRDEGSDSATALSSVDDFISEDRIDALIGPMS
jgi:ABC-type branched-subunit amino acid transport system substrate-binding protein